MSDPSQPAAPEDMIPDDIPGDPSPEAPTFQVTYTGPPARNTMRLDGEGELTFDEGEVIVEADQQPASGLPRRVRFMFTQREVARIGLHDGAVVLAIQPEAQPARTYYLSFYVSSEEDAHRVMALLHAPEASPPEVEDAQVRAFQARLRRAQAPATRGLLIANIAVFAMMVLSGVSLMTPNSADLIRWGARLNPLIEGGQWWRLLTPMFIHIGLPHLLFNMWALRNLGDFVERLFGTRRFLALYLATGLVGNISSFFFFPTVLAAGASGAIFGVLGALVGFIVRRRHAIPPPMLAHLRNSSLSFIALNLAFGFMVSGIDNSAHLGGLISGMLLGWVLAPAPARGGGAGSFQPPARPDHQHRPGGGVYRIDAARRHGDQQRARAQRVFHRDGARNHYRDHQGEVLGERPASARR